MIKEQTIFEIINALSEASIGLDAWLHTYASEFCDEIKVKEMNQKIWDNGGTLAYIADLQKNNRKLLELVKEKIKYNKKDIIYKFKQFFNLEKNWDGENANKPIKESIEHAIEFTEKFVNLLDLEVQVHATGTVGLSYADPYLYVDIEFLDLYNYSYYIDNDGNISKGTSNINLDLPKEIIL